MSSAWVQDLLSALSEGDQGPQEDKLTVTSSLTFLNKAVDPVHISLGMTLTFIQSKKAKGGNHLVVEVGGRFFLKFNNTSQDNLHGVETMVSSLEKSVFGKTKLFVPSTFCVLTADALTAQQELHGVCSFKSLHSSTRLTDSTASVLPSFLWHSWSAFRQMAQICKR